MPNICPQNNEYQTSSSPHRHGVACGSKRKTCRTAQCSDPGLLPGGVDGDDDDDSDASDHSDEEE